MRNIIHLTDLHIGGGNCRDVIKGVVGKIVNHLSPAEYIVIMTGDMVDVESVNALKDAWEVVLDPLRQAGFTLVQVPGNHDFGNGWVTYPGSVREFAQVVSGKPFPGAKPGPNFPAVRVDKVDDAHVVGFDSQQERLYWVQQPENTNEQRAKRPYNSSDGLQGWLGEEQRASLTNSLAGLPDGAKVILAMHHDPLYQLPTMGLGDYNLLESIVQAEQGRLQIRSLLCGHTHFFASRTNAWGIRHWYNGGTTGGMGKAPSPVRVFNIDNEPGAYDDLDAIIR